MRTQQAPEHELFVYKDNWRILLKNIGDTLDRLYIGIAFTALKKMN